MSQSIKKKLMALVVVGVMALPMASFANTPMLISENETVVISESVKEENNYMKYTGEIAEVRDNKGNISILVSSDDEADEYGFVFHISPDVSLWDRESGEMVKAKDLKVGMAVEVFYHQNTPTALSLPPQLTPAVIVIQGEEAMPTFMGEFDEDLVSGDKFLALNIGEETAIVNETGEELTAKDIAGQTALVFYEMSTKSIPAQTTPSKVVVFTATDEDVVEDLEADTDEEVEEVKEMISLRETAMALGYKVQWDNKDKTATITKENQTIVVKLGSVDYTLNKSLGKFSKAPELKNGTLYVQGSILEFME